MCCFHNQCPTCSRTLLYYDLFLAARSAPSQLCLHDIACSGCSYMEYTEQVQQGAGEANPPACIYNYYPVYIHAQGVKQLVLSICLCVSVRTKIARSVELGILLKCKYCNSIYFLLLRHTVNNCSVASSTRSVYHIAGNFGEH